VSGNTWTSAALGVARANLAAATAGNKILIGGGYLSSGFSSAVDVFTLSN